MHIGNDGDLEAALDVRQDLQPLVETGTTKRTY